MTKISIIGSGYVGLTTALSLCELGNKVVLVDTVREKVRTINEGTAPFFEPQVDELIGKHIGSGSLSATTDNDRAIMETDVTFIAVGTPMDDTGKMDPRYVTAASRSIARVLSSKEGYHLVVVKSTVVPGTTMGTIAGILGPESGKELGAGVGLAMCPEFLREGSAMYDAMHPDRIVIGAIDDRSFEVLDALFRPLGSRTLRTDPTTAEMIKYTSNSFLATKISFANEISRVCEVLGIDVYDVMEGVGMDSRISPKFLRAGVGFGGSCFPKDVSALMYKAKELGLRTPLLDSVMMNNELQPEHLAKVVRSLSGNLEGKRIAVLGLAFKPDTDDIRETRSLPLIRHLLSMGGDVRAHDPKAARNFARAYPDRSVTEDLEALLHWAQIVVLMTEWSEYKAIDWKGRSNIERIFDGRRTIDPSSAGDIPYWAMGRPL